MKVTIELREIFVTLKIFRHRHDYLHDVADALLRACVRVRVCAYV